LDGVSVVRVDRGGKNIRAGYDAWILDRYKSGLIADPTEGVRWLTQAYQLGVSMNALVRLGLFYVDEGRGEWQDRSKSFALFGQCIGYASANCQFAYAYHLQHGFGTPSDPAKSYTYYEVARVLGAPRAPERLQALDTRAAAPRSRRRR